MELTRDSAKVEGRYALRATSKIEGTLTGRRLDFRFHRFRDAQGWFDVATYGKSFSGATSTDGLFPGRGRKDRQPTTTSPCLG